MAIFQSSQILSSDGTVYSFSPTTAAIDGFSFAIPESFDIYHYDVLKVDENTNLLVGSASSIDGDGSGIFYTTFGNDGFSSEAITVLNENHYSNQLEPIIAKSDSQIIVTWYDQGQDLSTSHFFDILLNNLSEQINFNGRYYSEVVTAEDGRFILFSDYGYSKITNTVLSSDGIISSGNSLPSSIDSGFGATGSSNGKIWVATSHFENTVDVYLAELIDGALTENFRVNFNLSAAQTAPEIFETGNSNILVSWARSSTNSINVYTRDFSGELYGRFFSLEGDPQSLDFIIATNVASVDSYSISVRESGGFSIYYTDKNSSLKVKAFDALGEIVQEATLLAEFTGWDDIKVIKLSESQDQVFYTFDNHLFSQKINYNAIPNGDLLISGEAIEDTVLMLSNSLIDSDGLGAFSYQWLRNDEIINNATETSYQIGQADAGSLLKVQVQYVDGNGVTETVISDPTTTVQNVNDAPIGDLSISGQLLEGIELTAVSNISDEDGIGEFSYLWYRDNLLVSNANGSEFLLAQEDVGKSIKVEAIYTDGFGTPEKVTSSATDIVLNSNDSPQGTVSILGTITEGNTLTVEADITDADGLGSFTYQWMRDESVILGQTAEAYTLTQTDVGTQISVAVNYVDGFNYSETVNSPATNPIANLNTAAEGTVLISGIIAEKSTLNIIPSISDANLYVTFNINGCETVWKYPAQAKITIL